MGSYVSTYFSPDRGADDIIIGFIDRCLETIDAAVYSLTHDGIRDALIRAHQRGVQIRLLVDNLQAAGRGSDFEALVAAGLDAITDTSSYAMHNKFILGDSAAVITGSFNWTANAADNNSENFVIVRLKYVVEEFQTEFNALWNKNHDST
jgi:phosphatidylserine/phosphatidylglycerophosphate/cardiolipin synthase-like enzyme